MVKILMMTSRFPSRSSAIIEEYFYSQKIKFNVTCLFRDQIHNLCENRKTVISSMS
jgi:hypothetical protein